MKISTIGWVVASFGLAAAEVSPLSTPITPDLSAAVSNAASSITPDLSAAVSNAASPLSPAQSSAIEDALNSLNANGNPGTNSTVVSGGILGQATSVNIAGTLVVAVALYALFQTARSLRNEPAIVADRVVGLKTELVNVIDTSEKNAVEKGNPTTEMNQLVHSKFNACTAQAVIDQVEETTIRTTYNNLKRLALRCMRVNLSVLESLIQEERIMKIFLTAVKIQKLKKDNPHFDNNALSLRSLQTLTSKNVQDTILMLKASSKEAKVDISGDLSKFLLITGLGTNRFTETEKEKIAKGLGLFKSDCFAEDSFKMEVSSQRVAEALPA